VDVPQLRKLRHLPTEVVKEERAASQWSARHGVITLSSLLAAAMFAIAIWNWWTQPVVPVFKPAEYVHAVDGYLKDLTPAKSWDRWLDYRLLAERGLSTFEASNRAQIEAEIARRQSGRRMLWCLAAVFAAVAAAVALWPRSKAKR